MNLRWRGAIFGAVQIVIVGLAGLSVVSERYGYFYFYHLKFGSACCRPTHYFGCYQVIHEIAVQNGYSVSSQFTGHGIGTVFHRPPWIIHDRAFLPRLDSLRLWY